MTNKSIQRMNFCLSKADQLTTEASDLQKIAESLTEQAKKINERSSELLNQADGYITEATKIKDELVTET